MEENEVLVIQPTFGDAEDDVIVPSPIYQVYLVSGTWGEINLMDEVINNNEKEDNDSNLNVEHVEITSGLGYILLDMVGEDLDESLSYIWNFTYDNSILWNKTTIGTSLRISRDDLVLYNSAQSTKLAIVTAETNKISPEFIIK